MSARPEATNVTIDHFDTARTSVILPAAQPQYRMDEEDHDDEGPHGSL